VLEVRIRIDPGQLVSALDGDDLDALADELNRLGYGTPRPPVNMFREATDFLVDPIERLKVVSWLRLNGYTVDGKAVGE
jgi:hypothetical protein